MKRIIRSLIFLAFTFSMFGCSGFNAQGTSFNSEKKSSFKSYLHKQNDSKYLSQYKLLGSPFCDLTTIKGDDYSITGEKDYLLNNIPAAVITFKNDTIPLNFYINSEYEYIATDVFKTYPHKYDLLYHIEINKSGYEVFPGVFIGDTTQEIQRKTKTYFSEDMMVLEAFKSVNLNWIFCFDNGVLKSVNLYTSGAYCGDDDNSDHGLSAINDAFQYANSIGFTKYNVDKLDYFNKTFMPKHGGWFYHWYFDNSISFFSECGFPYRVFCENKLMWMNGDFYHPCAGFVGKWIGSAKPDYELEIEYISDFGEVQFNYTRKDHTISHINGVLALNNYLDVDAYSSDFYADIEYEDQYYGGGYGTIMGIKVHLQDSIRFDLSNFEIHFGGLNWKRDSVECDKEPSLSEGYMRYFGLYDPDLEERTTQNNGTDENKGAVLLNDFFNRSQGTSGLDYVQYYLEYVYDYYFKETDTIYFVWRHTRNGNLYYVDLNNRTILLETRESNFAPTIKKAVWSNGSIINNNASFFKGNWVSNDNTILLELDDKSNVSLTTSGALINEFKSIPSAKEEMNSKAAWLQINYFEYHYGSYDLCGYLLLNFYTWELTLHITRSNIPGIEMGIRKMLTENRWTYGDNISDYTPEEIDEINNENGKTLVSVVGITDFYGRILGKIEIYSNGDQIGYNYYGQVVGYYYQETNTTTDFNGAIVSYGNTLPALIIQSN